MTDKDLLTMLTSDDSARVVEAIKESTQHQDSVRRLDHEVWARQQEQMTESKLKLDQAYRTHVITTTLLNIMTSFAVIVLCVVVVKMAA